MVKVNMEIVHCSGLGVRGEGQPSYQLGSLRERWNCPSGIRGRTPRRPGR